MRDDFVSWKSAERSRRGAAPPFRHYLDDLPDDQRKRYEEMLAEIWERKVIYNRRRQGASPALVRYGDGNEDLEVPDRGSDP